MQFNRIIILIMITAVCIIQTIPIGVSSPDLVIQGYVYLNDELTIPEEVRLNIQNQMISAEISPDDGLYYTSVPTIAPGTIVTFLIKISGKSYTPPETLIIEDGIDYYGLDLHIDITENITPDQGNNGSSTPVNILPVSNPGGPYFAYIGLSIQVNGTKSIDQDGLITRYDWSFGDGTTSTGATPMHTYQQDGNYTVILRVTDDKGNSTQKSTYALINKLINILYFDTIGYLIDNQNDGTYDTFYSNITGNKTLLLQNNNIYLIDTDEDGNFDHQYNIFTRELDIYSAEQHSNNSLPSNMFIILAALAVLIIVTIALLASIKRKKQLSQKTILEEKVDNRYDQQKIDAPKITDVLVKEIQNKIDEPKLADVQVKEVEQKVDEPKVADVQVKEVEQNIDVAKVTDDRIKDIQQKVDELTINLKQKKKNNQ